MSYRRNLGFESVSSGLDHIHHGQRPATGFTELEAQTSHNARLPRSDPEAAPPSKSRLNGTRPRSATPGLQLIVPCRKRPALGGSRHPDPCVHKLQTDNAMLQLMKAKEESQISS